MLFVGTHERQLDDKGRLALPATFRAHLGERCYLAIGTGKCIDVVPAERFEAMADRLMDKVDRGELSLDHQRVVAASASLVTVDKQGRVNIEEKLRAYAGIGPNDRVVVSGNFRLIEIWSPERFEQRHQAATDQFAGDPA